MFVLILMYTLLLCSVICIFLGIIMFSFEIKQKICGKVREFSFLTVPLFCGGNYQPIALWGHHKAIMPRAPK